MKIPLSMSDYLSDPLFYPQKRRFMETMMFLAAIALTIKIVMDMLLQKRMAKRDNADHPFLKYDEFVK